MSNSLLPSETANSVHVMKMCQALGRRGHFVYLIAPDVGPKPHRKNESDEIFDYYGVDKCFRIKRLPFGSRNINSVTYFFSTMLYCFYIVLFLIKTRPNIVYGRYFTGCYVSVMLGFKTYFESHAPIWMVREASSEITNSGSRVRFFTQMISRRNFQKLIVISQALKDIYLGSGLIKDHDVEILHDSADMVPDFAPLKEWPGRKGHLQVGYVGSIYYGRGIEIIAKAAARLKDVDFHIVGGKKKDYRQFDGDFDSLSNIFLHGYVRPKDTYKYANSCDVLIAGYQKKVYVSGGAGDTAKFMSPLKIFEYMASKKAIISSDLPVLREILDERTAILAPPDDIEAWISAINRLRDKRLREKIAENAYELFLSRYTWDYRAERISKWIVCGTTGTKKVLFLAPSMRGGGAERFLTILLRNLNRERFEGSLGLVIKDGPFLDDIPEEVKILDLKSQRVRYVLFRLIRMIRQIDPNIVFSTIGHLSLFVIIARPALSRKTLFIARETNIPSVNINQSAFPILFLILYRWLYPKLDLLICQSQDMKNDLVENFGISEKSMVVINNPVDIEWVKKRAVSEKKLFDSGNYNLLAVGKLKYQKGFDLLIKTISLLDDERYHLTILGTGPDGESLKALANELGIAGQVTFQGFVENPYKYMAQTDIFVLSSRFEGFPNVVLEAMACGTPVVSFSCRGGIDEIIQDGVNGYSVDLEDISALARAIRKATSKNFDRNEIIKIASDKFDVHEIIPKYEKAVWDAYEKKRILQDS